MKKKNIIFVIVFVSIIIFGVYIVIKIQNKPGDYDALANCLTSKGAVMYGTDWCTYCKKQKEIFGKSFKYINYVNCDYDREECLEKGVRSYPSWIINGKIYSGARSSEELSSMSGCSLG